MNSDFKDLFRVFNELKVKYLLVGGYAVIEYTEPRYTKDLDVWVKADITNAECLFRALSSFGAPLTGLSSNDFAHEGFFFQMGLPPARIDILMSIAGVDFDLAWARKIIIQWEDVPVNLIGREDLIANKVAAGRPQDLIDVGSLKKL